MAPPGFPKTAKSWPASRGNLFAGGAGGTAKLVQQTSVTPNARYDITGWLGGTKTSSAELAVQFMDSSGRILGTAAIGPAGKQAKPVLDYRQAAGRVPAGATRAYLQSANGPCDDTVHGYYWNDDQPMMYFQDVRDRPRYCGIAAGDEFLKTGPPIRTGAFPVAAVFAPGGATLYVANFGGDSVTPVNTRTDRQGHPVPAGLVVIRKQQVTGAKMTEPPQSSICATAATKWSRRRRPQLP